MDADTRIVKECFPFRDLFTVFRIAGDIPNHANSIELDGSQYNLIPAYDYPMGTLAIKGKHDMNGKTIRFLDTKVTL